MLSFDQYIAESLSASPRHAKPITVPAPVLESLKAAGMLPATLPEPRTLAEAATLLIAKIAEMHRQQVGDPAASRSDKRISYQNLNNGFLTVLALSGSFPDPQESQ